MKTPRSKTNKIQIVFFLVEVQLFCVYHCKNVFKHRENIQ